MVTYDRVAYQLLRTYKLPWPENRWNSSRCRLLHYRPRTGVIKFSRASSASFPPYIPPMSISGVKNSVVHEPARGTPGLEGLEPARLEPGSSPLGSCTTLLVPHELSSVARISPISAPLAMLPQTEERQNMHILSPPGPAFTNANWRSRIS